MHECACWRVHISLLIQVCIHGYAKRKNVEQASENAIIGMNTLFMCGCKKLGTKSDTPFFFMRNNSLPVKGELCESKYCPVLIQ